MGKFIVVRHGESEANRTRTFAASGEVPLTAVGCSQAQELARHIGARYRPEALVSSKFKRALETAEIIGAALNLPVEVVEGLEERDLGYLKGRPWADKPDSAGDAASHLKTEQQWLWRPEGGESYEDVRSRAVTAFQALAMRYPDEELVIVTHGALMLALWAHLAGGYEHAKVPRNCGIMLIEHSEGRLGHPEIIDANGVEAGR
jgi:ribonuclease H / adenosylcobalamin/alpha-ribazole phosphatase